jgi:hypothetical protein
VSQRSGGRPRRVLAGISIAAALVVVAFAFLALTPLRHVAPGCFWWTAAQVGDLVPGSRGCVRGYVRIGGWLSEGTGPGDHSLFMRPAEPDQAITRAACPFQTGDAVVIRYHAVFDDGQTIVVVDDCR